MEQPLSVAEFMRALESVSQNVGAGIELLLRTMEPDAARLLRAAAIPRGFDAELLRVLEPALDPAEAERLCDRFLKLSMVTGVAGRLRLHDDARGYLFKGWLEADRRAEFATLSGRLAAHFAAEAERTSGAEQAAAVYNRIYHLLGADVAAGFEAFKARFREARAQFALAECEALLGLVKEYDALLDPVQRLWVMHFEGNLNADHRRFEEAERLYRTVLADESAPPDLRAGSFYRLGHVERDQHQWKEAKEAYGQALAILRSGAHADYLEYRVLDGLAAVQRETGELDEAEKTLEASIKLAEAKGDLAGLANSYNCLGMVLHARRDTQPALKALDQSIALLEQVKERFQQAQVFNNLGVVYIDLMQWEKGRDYLERCLAIEREKGHIHGQAKCLNNLVRVYFSINQPAQGFEAAERAAALFIDVHDWRHAGVAKRNLARILGRQKRREEARQALGEALALFQRAEAADEIASTQQDLKRMAKRYYLPWHMLPWYMWLALALLVGLIGLVIYFG